MSARKRPATKAKRKPSAKASPAEAAKRGKGFEGAAHRTSEWRHPDGSTIQAEMRTVVADGSLGALIAENVQLGKQHRMLQQEYDDPAKRHAFLLRDAAAQGRILAVYREQAANEVETTTSTGQLALAT